MTTIQDLYRQYETILIVADVAEIRCEGDFAAYQQILVDYGYPEMIQDFIELCLESNVDYKEIQNNYIRKKN